MVPPETGKDGSMMAIITTTTLRSYLKKKKNYKCYHHHFTWMEVLFKSIFQVVKEKKKNFRRARHIF